MDIEELKQRINELNYHYYTLDEPLVSDAEYDKLFDELVSLEKARGYSDPDSPTSRVGGEILSDFKKHTHLNPLFSLDKAQSIGAVDAWIVRTNKLIAEYNAGHEEKLPRPEYVLEYKFDGLTINLTYENGILKTASTRGNGINGEEILAQVKTINSIPLSIPYKGLIEIQGEGVMPLSKLEKYNEREAVPLKNARNAAAGALRNLDPKVTKSRELDCYLYNIGYSEEKLYSSQIEMFDFLRKNKLKVFNYAKVLTSVEEIEEEINHLATARKELDVLTDGVVIKINDIRTREVLGYTNRAPRWAIAYKFEAEEYTTILKEVVWNVGRTGKVTPSAILEPVDIGGVTVQRATLNNYDDIKRKDLYLGSRVWIRRSNDVIPEILGRIENEGLEEVEIKRPEFCPYCHTELVQNGVHIFCPNSISCRPQILSRLVHFCSRDGMDIEGLSEKTLEQFIEELGLSSLPDIYDIKFDQIRSLEGFKDKRSENIIQAIEKSKNVKLENFIYALGIPNVGIKTSRDLVNHFKTLDSIRTASLEDLTQIEDVGEIVARSIYDFFKDPEIEKGLGDLLGHGIIFEEVNEGTSQQNLLDKTIVVTGSFENMTRKEIEDLLIGKGAKVTKSVSKKTDYVLVGTDPGSKYTKAQELGITIINEEGLESFLNK